MSQATFASKSSADTVSKTKAAAESASGSLRIGEANDYFEQEADHVADEIMAGRRAKREWSLSRMSVDNWLQPKGTGGGSPGLIGERAEPVREKGALQSAGEQNASGAIIGPSQKPQAQESHAIADGPMAAARRPAASAEALRIHRSTGRAAGLTDATARASVDRVLAGPGSPLHSALREDMEQRFGRDFSRVRVHSNDDAERSTREVDAQAYTVGRDIVFGEGRYVPATNEGQRLIAHELTHVVQQESTASSAPTLMRAGRTFGGFLANIFQFWDYSKKSLDAYLKILDRENRIQGDDDSDDMARQIVKEWKESKSSYNLTPKIKVLLVREMLDGVVSGADQDGIMDLLEGSLNSDLQSMFSAGPNHLTYREIHTKFGSRKQRLELFDTKVLRKLDRLKSPDPADAKSVESRLEGVEKQSGVAFQDLSVSFQLAPGTLYKSFLVDLKTSEWGASVTITLTRSRLEVRIAPSILIDVIWPLSNASLNGFTLTFAGLKPKLDIDGIETVASGAQKEVQSYLKGVLAGTRFEDPAYDPVKDPNLVSELLDPQVIGDVDRVKYNFEKNIQKSDSDSKVAEGISGFGINLNLVHKRGMPVPSAGWGVVIVPGTGFNLRIATSGTASEAMKKNLRMERLDLTSGGIFIYRGKDKIAMLTSIEMDRGLKITLGGVKSFVDLKEIMKQESPDWLKGLTSKATDLLRRYDDTVDWWNNFITAGGLVGDPGPKSDVATPIATSVAETVLSWTVRGILRDQWHEIQAALGLTDLQIANFFGLGPGTEEQP